MPYDSQGRWIEENEWQQMMREQAARRVGAFSRYNTPAPSVYPNQAAPYGSFGTTPSVGPYQTSPFMRRQEPAVLPWMDLNDPGQKKPGIQDKNFEWSFMKDPVALNEALSKPSFTDPLNVLNQEATGTITPTEDVNLAGMPFAGAVTGANELINKAPFVSANPLSVLAKTEMLPNIFNYDAGPVVQNAFDTIMPTADAYVPPTNVDYPPELDPNRLDPAVTQRWVDWQSAQNDSGMTPEKSVALGTPAAYTGELDRYGLGGWTPEVPGDPVADSYDFTKGIRDWAKDLIGTGPTDSTTNTIIDLALSNPQTLISMIDPRSAKAKEEAIIDKARTAPKGALERLAPADINAMLSNAYTGTDSVFTGDEVDVAFGTKPNTTDGVGIPWGEAIGRMLGAPIDEPGQIGGRLGLGLGTAGAIAAAIAMSNRDEEVAPAGPSAADIQRDKQAAVDARLAQQAAARIQQQQQMDAEIASQAEQARQVQAAQAAKDAQAQALQAQLAYAAMRSQLMQGRDRGEPSAREIERAMERATQVDTFGHIGRQEQEAADRASVGIDRSDRSFGPR